MYSQNDMDMIQNTIEDNFSQISGSLYSIQTTLEENISSREPFLLRMRIKSTRRFIRYLFKSSLVFNFIYQDIYDKLYKMKNKLNVTSSEQNELGDFVDNILEHIISYFKFDRTKEYSKEKFSDLEYQLNNALYAVGRMPFPEFLDKYECLIEYAYCCVIIRGTEYAIDCNIPIGNFSLKDYDMLGIVLESIFLRNGIIENTFLSSEERQNYTANIEYCLNEVSKYLLFNLFHTIDRNKQIQLIDYLFNSADFSFSLNKDKHMFRENMNHDYNIEHFINEKDGNKYYYFKITIINEYITQRVTTGTIEDITRKAANEFSIIDEVKITNGAEKLVDDTFISPSIQIGCDYDASILSEYMDQIVKEYVDEAKNIINDYVRENVKKQIKKL